ncbi:MAG TPA: gamma-glutamyltransferase family protein [Gammaproteobacteria bacterium]|nr:gamma-glutamyltransferase family protein [Gammaproteobacteria bacterium]
MQQDMETSIDISRPGVAASGRHGMVATSQPAATAAGLALLRRGGSAVDAAIAANLALAVTEPYMCGPGGDLFAMLWDPYGRCLHGLNASGRSASRRSLGALRELLAASSTLPIRGPHCVTVPGAVDGWALLHQRFGRLPWPALFEPALALARDGFVPGPVTLRWWQRAVVEVRGDPAARAQLDDFLTVFAPGGAAPQPGALLRNVDLAETFERLAARGRAGFYEGAYAQRFVEALNSAGADFARDDLARRHAEWVTPLRTDYRGVTVCALPPNGQGAAALQMLNILEGYAPTAPDAVDWWHRYIEAKKLAFADRARWYADPAHARAPLEALLDNAYAARRRALIDPDRAAEHCEPGAFPGGDTTYLAAADRDGMMVSLIQSIFNPFGSALVVPGTGFAWQSRGAGFALDPAHANCYQPGKRPFHTIMPGFALKDGRPWLAFGVMGADMQPQGQVQILVNLIDFGDDVASCALRPRLRHAGGAQPNGLVEPGVGTVFVEPAMPAAVVDGLRARGHRVVEITDPIGNFVGGYQGILCDPASGLYRGGSEPRFDGCAMGY